MTWIRRMAMIAVLGSALTLAGCKKPEKKEAKPVKRPVSEKFTAADLRPSVSADGLPSRLPHAVEFIFLRAPIKPEQAGKAAGKDTVVKFTPELEGDLKWRSEYILEFKPKAPFPFERSLLAQLLKVETSQGPMSPPAGEKWELQFVTPAFEFRRVELRDVDFSEATAWLVVTFSGPVSLDSLKAHTRVAQAGTPLTNLDFSALDPETVSIEIHSLRPGANQKLKILFTPGIASADGKAALSSEASEEFVLAEPKHLEITGVRVKEGDNGYYLEVSCRDEAHRERFWGYDDYYWECTLPPDSLRDYLELSPGLKLSALPVRSGFRIFGDFRRGSYNLKIASGLHSIYGGVLTQTYETTVNLPARTPKVSFVSKGRYLPRTYLSALPVSSVNVSQVTISARQIFPDNLVFWLSGESEKADDRVSDQVGSKSFDLPSPEDVKTTSWLDLTGLLPENKKGVFELTLSGASQSDSARLILTDLALVTKQSGSDGQNFDLWALSIRDLKPAAGVKVDLLTMSNRSLASCTTDSEGACRFKDLLDPLKQKKPFALIASSGEDLIALKFSDLAIPTGDFSVQGPPYRQKSPYSAAIYSDRGVYRPGETAHVSAILRDENNLAPKAGLPVVGRCLDPRKKQVGMVNGKANAAGMVSFDLPFQAFAATGKYEFDLEVGGNQIANYAFNVEEFVPERMKVSVTPEKPAYLQSEKAGLKISAQYLFGAVASGEKVELSCTLSEGLFKPEKNQTYSYAVWRKEPLKPIALGTMTGNLDEKGTAALECPAVESQTAFQGMGSLTAMASVFEAGSGRTTVAQAVIPIHPDTFYIGLQASAGKAQTGKAVNVQGVIVDWSGTPLTESRKVKLEVVRLEPQWVWEYDEESGGENYSRYLQELPVSRDTVPAANGQFNYSFTPDAPAERFLVRASSGERAETAIEIPGEGYAEWWEPYVTQLEQTPKPMKPQSLEIETPDKLKAGESGRVILHPPYKGRMLFTVETDQLLESRWLEVTAEPVTLSFTVGSFYPNVYVSALVLKDPHLESEQAFMPARAFAVKSIAMAPEKYQMSLNLGLPGEIRPNSEFSVTLDLGRQDSPVFATVAAVDEGILSLTRFRSPDPLSLLFQKRGLGVDTFETIGWTLMIPPIAREEKPGGGEAQAGLPGRIQPVKPVALWSGLVAVPDSGKAEIKFKVPTYRGQLRVMAVAASASRIASAEGRITVRDPLVLQTTFPRFLLNNDRFVVPVFLTNLTGKDDKFSVKFEAGKNISIEGGDQKEISLAPNQAGTVTFVARALAASGAARFEVTAKGGGAVSNDRGEIPFLPNAPVTRETTVYQLEAGKKTSLLDSFAGWNPQYEKTTVWVTGNKYGKEMSHLKWLIQYPYGCIEQTTSFTRPLLYIGTILYSVAPEEMQKAGIEDKFMHGANRLLSMQTSDGGFSYWPGAQAPTFWGTAYATYTLGLGKEQGYPIPPDRLEDALKFMENALNGDLSRTDAKYGYSVAKSEPMMQYVLALTGRTSRKGRIGQLIKNPDPGWGELTEENLFLLKAALYLDGDRTYEKDLKNPYPGKISDRRANDWGFWSDLRTKGMMLDIMEELFPGSKEAEPLADEIANRLKSSTYGFTTQEISWCVSGLGKRVSKVATSWSPPKVFLNGKALEPAPKPPKGGADFTWVIAGASGAKELQVLTDKISGGVLFALVTVEGEKPGVPYEQGDHSVRVSRRYRYAEGEEVQMSNVKLGEVVYVDLTLANLTRDNILNLVLQDRFGAGLEIENPRLSRTHAVNWTNTDHLWEVSYIDMRDDQIAFFGHLEPNQEVSLVYALRAVTAGEFSTPPVRAEAMYEPRIWSQKPGADLRILDPWKALTQ